MAPEMKDEILAASLRALLDRMKVLLKDVEENQLTTADRLSSLRDIENKLRLLREAR